MSKVRGSLWSWLAPLALLAPLLASAPARAAEEAPAAPSASASASAATARETEPHAEKGEPKKPATAGDVAGAHHSDDTDIEAPVDRKGEVVELGLSVSAVNKLDPVKGVYEIEGLLTMHGKKVLPPCKKERIAEMFDGEAKRADLVEEEKADDGSIWRVCKVAVELQADLDVKRYPFDAHQLVIEVLDQEDANDGVEYHVLKTKYGEADTTGVSPSFTLPGWDLVGFKGETVKSKAEGSREQITQARFTLELKRPFFASVVKALLAVFFQLLVTLIAILVPVKNITNRITMVTGALLAIAATHNTVSSQISAPYLTTADKFYIACYFSLLVNVFLSALMLRADNEKQEERAKSLYRLALVVVPVVTLLATALALLPIG